MDDPLEKANQRIGALRAEITSKLKQIKERDDKINVLNKNIADKDKIIANLQQTLIDNEKAHLADSTNRINDLSERETELSELTAQVEAERAQLETERAALIQQHDEDQDKLDAMANHVKTVTKENERWERANLALAAEYEAKVAKLSANAAAESSNFSQRIFALENDMETKQTIIQTQSNMIALFEAKLRDEEEMAKKKEREREDERLKIEEEHNNERKEYEIIRDKLQADYLSLKHDVEQHLLHIQQETSIREDRLNALLQWEQQRQNIEETNERLLQTNNELTRQLESLKGFNEKMEKDHTRDMTQIQAVVAKLETEKNKLAHKLKQKKDALDVYHKELEATKAEAKAAKEEEARLAEAKPKGFSLSTLFGGGSAKPPEKNGSAPATGTQLMRGNSNGSPIKSKKATSADSDFLDIEEEMSVALTARIEKLSDEKSKLNEELILLRRQVEREQYLSAQLRAQLAEFQASKSKDREQIKKDKVLLSAENQAKLLAETIAENREMSDQLKEKEKELKRLKGQLEVRKQELAEIKGLVAQATGGSATGTATPQRRTPSKALATPSRATPRRTISIGTPVSAIMGTSDLTSTGGKLGMNGSASAVNAAILNEQPPSSASSTATTLAGSDSSATT